MKKKEKTSLIGFGKRNLTYIVYRKRISKIAKENKQGGNPNGAMRRFLVV